MPVRQGSQPRPTRGADQGTAGDAGHHGHAAGLKFLPEVVGDDAVRVGHRARPNGLHDQPHENNPPTVKHGWTIAGFPNLANGTMAGETL